MDNGATAGHLLRLVGFFSIAIGVAWAVQTVGFGHDNLGAKLMWVVAAASMSGAGAGLLLASTGLQAKDGLETVRA